LKQPFEIGRSRARVPLLRFDGAAVSDGARAASHLAVKVMGGIMGLVDAFRKADEQARKAAGAGIERAKVAPDDAERAIRRRMRIYPKQVSAAAGAKTTAMTACPGKADARPAEPSRH
jgi:hypothetical protein